MRKPRDYDSELKALDDKARQLRARKVQQLGELVVATGADALPVELLAGVLLSAIDNRNAAMREGWQTRGAAFFQRAARIASPGDRGKSRGAQTNEGGAQPDPAQDRT